MEAAVEVVLPETVAVDRLMGSPEDLCSGGVVVGEVQWVTKDAISSGGRKDDIHAGNISAPSFWSKIPNSEPCVEVSQPYSLHTDDVLNDCKLGNMNSHPPTLDIDVNQLQKSGAIGRKSGGCSKTSRMVQIGSSKSKHGLHDVNGISPEVVASSSASQNTSDKSQLIKLKNSSTSRRGDKRNSKVKNKNRCNSFSLKNGLVGFNSVAGGNKFLGMYGLKFDVFDITKYVNKPSLHELLHGSYTSPCIAKDKGKKAANSNNDLLQSVRNACAVLEARKVLQARNCAETDNSCNESVSTALVTVNSDVGQTDGEKGDSYTAVLSSSNKVQESHEKTKMPSVADSPLHTPKEILERLSLPPTKDLDLLLSDTSKPTFSSRNSADLRFGKSPPKITGLPAFPWSQSFSGNSKSGSDAVKSSTSRTTCQGRWVKVKNSFALQKGAAGLLVDFESLTFDKSLVPSTNLTSEEFSLIARVVPTSIACSTSEIPADERSPTYTAAQTLLDMAAYSKENPHTAMKLLKKPSAMAMKASKSKAIKRPNSLDAPNSTSQPIHSLKNGQYGLSSSKKPKLSLDATNTHIGHIEPVRKGKSPHSERVSFKSPPRKQLRDTNANTDNYGINLAMKTSAMKTPRSTDRPLGSAKQELWKPSL